MKLLVWLAVISGIAVAGVNTAYSQNVNNVADSLNFPASQLSEAAARYAGAAQNWPVLSSLAEYDAQTNRFTILPSNLETLAQFSTAWSQLEASRTRFSQLILEGGRVFAAEELVVIDSLFARHRRLVSEANIPESIRLSGTIDERVQEVNDLIETRRKADIEARLEQKTGQVDRREGLLAEWNPAATGELFVREDGIRTGQESQAQLVFLDGSDVVLYENTTAVIRQSQVDRLTNRSEVDIELSGGGLLTRLSAAARNQSEYSLNAGSATTDIRSGNFWAETASEDRVTMSNFDGEVTVRAEAGQVLLQENEGTIVIRGREPSDPIRLLTAPQHGWSSPDSVIYNDEIDLTWQEVNGASYYEVDMAPSRTFDAGLRTVRTSGTVAALTGIPVGISYLQIRAFDQNGLRGNNTAPLRLLRIATDAPPPIILDQRDRQVIYTYEQDFRLTGTTQPDVRLLVNGSDVQVDISVRFAAPLTVEDERSVRIQAIDPAGNTREVTQKIQYIDTGRLFDLSWSVPVTGNQVTRTPRILISGSAWPFMRVEIQAGDQRWQMPVGSTGQWSRQISPGNADSIIITFKDRSSGETIAEQSFELN